MSLRTRWRPGDRFLVRHKDNAIVVVEKKAGLLTVRLESGKGVDLMMLLEEFLDAKHGRNKVYPVHRLDRHVSGLLVVARTYEAREVLSAQFAAHEVERRYVALVQGNLREDEGTFESKLASGPDLRMASSEEGKIAITHWRVIERYPQATLVEVQLETGLRNQIRVHFAEAGHPLFGEQKYLPRKKSSDSASQTRRIFLHAQVLGFHHPVTGEEMRFEAPLPPELTAWLRAVASGKTRPAQPRHRGPRSRGRTRARRR
jgi:23S rRNA pseudouridine1911/1915/1917 synthase